MAQTLTDYDFTGNHGNAKYPWHEWGDGRIVKLIRGEDFDIEPAVMRGQVIVRARKESKAFRTNVRGDEGIREAHRSARSRVKLTACTSIPG